jgi:hypothetical protein
MDTTIGGMGMRRYLKQFAIGVLFAACFMLISLACFHGKPALIVAAALLAGLNAMLYPYSHLVQESVQRYFRKRDTGATNTQQSNTNDESGWQIGGDSVADTFIALALLIAITYFLSTVGLRVVFWLLALPLAYFGVRLLRSEPEGDA